jgi:uncharacterized protein YbjT (DUF2867 family)
MNRHDVNLVLGGTGKTGRRVAERLQTLGLQFRLGSRSGQPTVCNALSVVRRVISRITRSARPLPACGATRREYADATNRALA